MYFNIPSSSTSISSLAVEVDPLPNAHLFPQPHNLDPH